MDRMEPTLKRCSNCNHWKGSSVLIEGVLARTCEVQLVNNNALGLTSKTTKGSDICSKWEKIKPPAPPEPEPFYEIDYQQFPIY